MDTKERLREMVLEAAKKLEGRTLNEDTGEEYTALEFLDECLSVEAVCKRPDGSWYGAIMRYTAGGPNIFIDTHWNQVEGYWGDDEVTMSYRDEIGLDEFLVDMYGGDQ
jgi:hypothetical protein